jgi:hypothetical protein
VARSVAFAQQPDLQPDALLEPAPPHTMPSPAGDLPRCVEEVLTEPPSLGRCPPEAHPLASSSHRPAHRIGPAPPAQQLPSLEVMRALTWEDLDNAHQLYMRLPRQGAQRRGLFREQLSRHNLDFATGFLEHLGLVNFQWRFDPEWKCYMKGRETDSGGTWEYLGVSTHWRLSKWVWKSSVPVIDLEAIQTGALKPAWDPVPLPRSTQALEKGLMSKEGRRAAEARASKSKHRGTSLISRCSLAPKSRSSGRRKQEIQYRPPRESPRASPAEESPRALPGEESPRASPAESVAWRRRHEQAAARGGKPRRQGGLHAEEDMIYDPAYEPTSPRDSEAAHAAGDEIEAMEAARPASPASLAETWSLPSEAEAVPGEAPYATASLATTPRLPPDATTPQATTPRLPLEEDMQLEREAELIEVAQLFSEFSPDGVPPDPCLTEAIPDRVVAQILGEGVVGEDAMAPDALADEIPDDVLAKILGEGLDGESAPAPRWDACDYTRQHESQRIQSGSRRGRVKNLARDAKQGLFTTRARVEHVRSTTLGAFAIDNKFCADHRGQPCSYCAKVDWQQRKKGKPGTWKLGEATRCPETDMDCMVPVYVCSTNSKHQMPLTEGEEDLFPSANSKFNLRLYFQMLWDICYGLGTPSPEALSAFLGIKVDNLRPYYDRVLKYVELYQEEQNANLVVGGLGDLDSPQEGARCPKEVEMDAMTFRLKGVWLKTLIEQLPQIRHLIPQDVDVRTVKVVALRLFGAFTRGTSKHYLEWLVPKLVQSGGGGPEENEELWRAIGNKTPAGEDRPWKVSYGSIVHTNAARSYANLGWDTTRHSSVATTAEENAKSAEACQIVTCRGVDKWKAEEKAVQVERVQTEREHDFHRDRRVTLWAGVTSYGNVPRQQVFFYRILL